MAMRRDESVLLANTKLRNGTCECHEIRPSLFPLMAHEVPTGGTEEGTNRNAAGGVRTGGGDDLRGVN